MKKTNFKTYNMETTLSKKDHLTIFELAKVKNFWRNNGNFNSILYNAFLNVISGEIQAPIKILNNAEIRKEANLRTINPY